MPAWVVLGPVPHALRLAEPSPAALTPPEVHQHPTGVVVARVDRAILVVAALHPDEGTSTVPGGCCRSSENGPTGVRGKYSAAAGRTPPGLRAGRGHAPYVREWKT